MMDSTLKNAQVLGRCAPAPTQPYQTLSSQPPPPLGPNQNPTSNIDGYRATAPLPKAIAAAPHLDAAFKETSTTQHSATNFHEDLNNAIALHLSQSAPELAKEILGGNLQEHDSSESKILFEHPHWQRNRYWVLNLHD